MAEHQLQHEWTFYLHFPIYSLNTKSYSNQAYQALGSVKTVESFWHYVEYIPLPTDVFASLYKNKVIRPKVNGRALEALGLFKAGPKPEWEDPLNLKGGHWECRKEFALKTLDALWKDVCMALVGEQLERGRDIVGARVVDKTNAKKVEYRLEFWLSTTNEDVKGEVLGNILNVCQKHDADVRFAWKSHGESLHNALECNKQQLGL